jgi:hypothetical protein
MTFDPMIDAVACEELSGLYKAIYDLHLQEMASHQRNANPEQAARWGMVAATHAYGNGFFGMLGDPALEERLRSIGRDLPTFPLNRPAKTSTNFLHVLTEALPVGGHTRYCCRWIENDSSTRRHHVLLTSQRRGIPDDLKQTVEHYGGQLTVLNSQLPLLERATQLREIACQQADAVILHADMGDVLPVIAFAVEHAPPVLLVNHADHVYWLGASVADLVVNIRASGDDLTRRFRGIENSICLPIPLKETGDEMGACERKKLERARLGIPPEAVVFVTIASAYKYTAMNNYSFINAAGQILERCPKAYLIAVGPESEGPWAAAAAKFAGRLMALGVREVVSPFHAVADVYLEGFPFGSLTSLLEAGLSGLPCVGAPGTTPLPLRSDDVALAHLRTPASVEDYILEALRLAGDGSARLVEGQRIQTAIREHHCGAGWLKHLAKVYQCIPEKHNVWLRTTSPIPDLIRNYWVSFQIGSGGAGIGEVLIAPYRKTESQGLRLRRSTGKRVHSDLLAIARQLSERTGQNLNGFEISAIDGYHAYIERDLLRLLRNYFRSAYTDANNHRSRELKSLIVQYLIGTRSKERLRTLMSRL